MRWAEPRRLGILAAALGVGVGLGFGGDIRTALGLAGVRGGVAGAAAAARGAPGAVGLDLACDLASLSLDPEVRASRALYDAALLAADRGVDVGLTGPRLGARGIRATLQAAQRLLQASRTRTPPAAAPGLQLAARLTGVELAYLHRTAGVESGFDPYARATTSTARGLFQFVDQTWLRAIAQWGGRHGRSREAELVHFDRRGRAYVADPAQARAILALRYDPDLSALMAAELARENRAVLGASLGRPLRGGELYAAHLFGAEGALRLIRAAEFAPGTPADALLPAAAAANTPLFYRSGRRRSAAEVLLALP